MFPLPEGVETLSVNDVPPPRVSLKSAPQTVVVSEQDPLKTDLQYHKGTVKANERITAPDWYQDVRHFEIEFEDNIQ